MAYKKIEEYTDETTNILMDNYHKVLEQLGEDPEREGLVKTPERVAKAMQFLTHGYDLDPAEILKKAMFKEDCSEMVIVKNVELYSLCEHHMLPFYGKAHIAYIPNGYIVGLSKIPRIVDAFARRLQVQERLTEQVMNCIQDRNKKRICEFTWSEVALDCSMGLTRANSTGPYLHQAVFKSISSPIKTALN